MANRIGPGPVFVYESLILARRRQVYAGRALFVLAVFIGLGTAWCDSNAGRRVAVATRRAGGTLQMLALTGQKFFYALAGIQLAMVLLVAPAATAGAICHDRARGIFAQLAVTDLSDAEIVLGKLGSRLAPILGLLACGLPVTALAALWAGSIRRRSSACSPSRRRSPCWAVRWRWRSRYGPPRPTRSSSPCWPSGCSGC